MHVDALGTQAGAALRGEYDHVNAPPLPPSRVRHTALRSVAIGLVVALLVGGLVAVVRSGRDAVSSGRDGATWVRRSAARAFGASTTDISIIGTPNGFVATGIIIRRNQSTAAVWTSREGERWSRVSTTGLPREPRAARGRSSGTVATSACGTVRSTCRVTCVRGDGC